MFLQEYSNPSGQPDRFFTVFLCLPYFLLNRTTINPGKRKFCSWDYLSQSQVKMTISWNGHPQGTESCIAQVRFSRLRACPHNHRSVFNNDPPLLKVKKTTFLSQNNCCHFNLFEVLKTFPRRSAQLFFSLTWQLSEHVQYKRKAITLNITSLESKTG